MGAFLVLNLSLLFAVLLAPAVLILSVWYRRSLGRPLMEWPRQEMVMVTILSAVCALLLMAIGVSCFFTYMGYLDPNRLPLLFHQQYFYFGLSCILFIAGLTMSYLAIRKVMVQMVLPEGVMAAKGLLPLAKRSAVVRWEDIADYYVHSDYPNTVFILIVKDGPATFKRLSLKVPIYLKEDFQRHLDEEIGMANTYREDSHREGQYFPNGD